MWLWSHWALISIGHQFNFIKEKFRIEKWFMRMWNSCRCSAHTSNCVTTNAVNYTDADFAERSNDTINHRIERIRVDFLSLQIQFNITISCIIYFNYCYISGRDAEREQRMRKKNKWIVTKSAPFIVRCFSHAENRRPVGNLCSLPFHVPSLHAGARDHIFFYSFAPIVQRGQQFSAHSARNKSLQIQ